jgi:hypothetical protein
MRNGMARQIVVFPGSSSVVATEGSSSPAEDAFERIQSLLGAWEGMDDHGVVARATFKVIAANTAVMETLAISSGRQEMVTLYSLHGGAISLIHYGAANNQPHLKAFPPKGPIHELVFEFKDARNLFSSTAGRVQKLVLRFEDVDHVTETWTWRRDQCDSSVTYKFTRRKPGAPPKESSGSMLQEAIEFQDV